MVLFSVSLMLIVLFWERGIMGSEEFSWDSLIARFNELKNILLKMNDSELQRLSRQLDRLEQVIAEIRDNM